MRVGTENNPIKLVNESIERPLLLEYCKLTSENHFDFHALPDFGDDCFVMNVLFNPHLTLSEVKFAIYLFHELEDGGKIFSTSFAGNFNSTLTYGGMCSIDDDWMHGITIGSEYSLRATKLPSTKNGLYLSLAKIAAFMGFKLSSERLIKLLRRLHDFGYVTITDISKYNTYEPPENSDIKNTRARLRHIRLCFGMRRKDLTGRWIKKKPNKAKSGRALKTKLP